MLRRIVFALIIAIAAGGCGDSPESSTADVANTTQSSEANADAREPAGATTTGPHEFHGPREVIVVGRLTVDVMELVIPQRVTDLTQRLLKAVRENPDWWSEHVKQAKPGEPLPYDSRLGLSESEYNEFLALSKKMTMRKKAEATLIVSTDGDDVYLLDGGQALPDFTGIEIDLKNDLVCTPFGVATKRSEIHAPEDSALGAWDGVQWKLENPGPNGITGTFAKLAVGRQKRSGRCVIYYDAKKFGLDEMTRISNVLIYDLPAK